MYYNRTISEEFAELFKENGKLRWLFDFVKNHKELDFIIVKTRSEENVHVYRGLTRIVSISLKKDATLFVNTCNQYKKLLPKLYGEKSINENFQNDIEALIQKIEQNSNFDRYYKNKKEGYYQNELSRFYGINGTLDTDFVIIDKEVVIGHSSKVQKDSFLEIFQKKYKDLHKEISSLDLKRYGEYSEKKPIGDELDFLALDKDGNILLIEFKHGNNTSGIYLSPLQIGMYNDIFEQFPRKDLENAVFDMLQQKQEIGLINPKWKKPNCIKDIIPVLIISEFNYRSSAKKKFDEVLQFSRKRLGQSFLNFLQTFNITDENGLTNW